MLCAFFCVFLRELLTHLNTIHRDDNDFSQNCGLPDCSFTTRYTSANSFVKHVRNQHRTLFDSTYEAVFDGNQDIHECDQDLGSHVSDTGNVFYLGYHLQHGYHEFRVTTFPVGEGGWGREWGCEWWAGEVDVFITYMFGFGNNYYYFH